jgi:hypothetical protein
MSSITAVKTGMLPLSGLLLWITVSYIFDDIRPSNAGSSIFSAASIPGHSSYIIAIVKQQIAALKIFSIHRLLYEFLLGFLSAHYRWNI